MKEITEHLLNELEQLEWFHSVGVHAATKKKGDTSSPAIVSSWKEAMTSCSSVNYENVCYAAANNCRGQLLKRSEERYSEWNLIVDKVKPHIEDLVVRKTKKVIIEHQLPDIFINIVKWDILHFAMETEYSDILLPGFYTNQVGWYCKGHFPCGWRGKFPKGTLIIY